VKAFTDTLLDLTVDTPETRSNVVDLLGRQELLYLGPDEQVTLVSVTAVHGDLFCHRSRLIAAGLSSSFCIVSVGRTRVELTHHQHY
jgi:hypothetical protein